MANDVNPPRGMRDFLPLEHSKRSVVLNAIRGTYAAHGYQEIETPAMEDLGRLTSGQGGDNEKLAYRVLKRGEELESALAGGGELADLGLRFDLTVPLTRYYATNRAKLPAVFKAIQTGPVWRAERPQKGRYRQFVQCDIDIIGDSSELAEVDLLISSLDALAQIGLSDAVIRVNHRALLNALLEQLGVPETGRPSAMITIDKLDKIGSDGVAKELEEKFGTDVAAAAATWMAGIVGELEVPVELMTLFAAVESRFAGRLRFDPTLVRGMGYYTGAIFEIEHPESGSSIGGGGRYDGMVGKWLGTDVPAVGISIGFERVVDLVEAAALKNHIGGIVLVLENNEARTLANAIARQSELMARGETVRLENRPKKLNLLLDSLAENGFDRFASVSEETLTLEGLNLRPLG
jgi:histidyl-tRNA synthetase